METRCRRLPSVREAGEHPSWTLGCGGPTVRTWAKLPSSPPSLRAQFLESTSRRRSPDPRPLATGTRLGVSSASRWKCSAPQRGGDSNVTRTGPNRWRRTTTTSSLARSTLRVTTCGAAIFFQPRCALRLGFSRGSQGRALLVHRGRQGRCSNTAPFRGRGVSSWTRGSARSGTSTRETSEHETTVHQRVLRQSEPKGSL